MKITNILHFTENHRFYIFRDFSLSSLDYKMLSSIYQPMVGAYAISVYTLLYQQISAEKTGYSKLDQQRKLFLALDLELSERGRNYLIEQTSKLEAIGLLQTSRKYVSQGDDYIYEYQLVQPLSPNEFFRNQHLAMLLRDKVGKYAVLSFREELHSIEPEELGGQGINSENLSIPFYELFKLNTQVIDYELEQALLEIAPVRQEDQKPSSGEKAFVYSDIIMRFPRESYNRVHVESLKNEPEQMAAINYVANKYKLSLQEMCRLLDEDGVFSEEEGDLLVDRLQQKANLNYRQGKKRDDERERYLHKTAGGDQEEEFAEQEEKAVEMQYYLEIPAMFQGDCDIHQYNTILRNEPYTRVLERFFPGSVPEYLLDIFAKVDLNYKLKEEVINVLIHYLKVNNLNWNGPFIDSIVSEMLGKQIATYEQAVQYIKDRAMLKEKKLSKSTGAADRGRGKQKPKIPIISNVEKKKALTEEEYEEILKKARRLDERFKG